MFPPLLAVYVTAFIMSSAMIASFAGMIIPFVIHAIARTSSRTTGILAYHYSYRTAIDMTVKRMETAVFSF